MFNHRIIVEAMAIVSLLTLALVLARVADAQEVEEFDQNQIRDLEESVEELKVENDEQFVQIEELREWQDDWDRTVDCCLYGTGCVAQNHEALDEEIEEQLEAEAPDEQVVMESADGESLFILCFQEDEGPEYCAISSDERGFVQLMILWSEDAIGQRAFMLVDVPKFYQERGKVTQIFKTPGRPWINIVLDGTYNVVFELDTRQWH